VSGNEGARTRWILLTTLLAVPLVPNPGWFTNSDDPKWAVLVAGTAAALLVVLWRAVRSKEEVRVILPEHLVILAILVLAALFSGPRAPDERASLRALALIGTLTAFGIAAAQYLRDETWCRRALLVSIGAAGAAAAFGIVQWLLGAKPTSTFGNPSFGAEFAASALCLTLIWVRRPLVLLAAVPLLVFVVLAKSRADWAGLAAGLTVCGLLWLLGRARRRPPRQAIAAAVIAGAVFLPYAFQVLPLPHLGRGDTVEIRRLVRNSTFEMALDRPGVGVGLEGFRAMYPKYRDPEEARLSMRREVTFPHNLPLVVFAETGVPGLLMLLLVLWAPLSSGIRTVFARPEDRVALGATAGFVAILVSAQLSAPLRHPASALLFFLLGAVLVARRPRRIVTDLKARHRRALPVLLLVVPVATAAAVLPGHLAADHYLAAARARELEQQGAMDAEVARLLERSVDREPGPDALRQLAFFRTGTGEPKRALALVATLLTISPHDEQGRIEKARALIADGSPKGALGLLEELVVARPGDDVALFLRARARWEAEEDRGALEDFLEALKIAPVESARRHAKWANDLPPYFQDAVLDVAARLAEEDLERGLAILSAVRGRESDYRRALVFVKRGDLDRAMSILRLMKGFLDPARLRHDPRLAPLRHRADFEALIEGD
jgi:tetratricopeptide (TPR) repeat protein